MTLRLLLAWVILGATVARAQAIPQTEEQALSGEKININQALAGKVGVVVTGFSAACKDQATRWFNQLNKDFGNDGQVAVFDMPMLEGAPRLVRGMIVRGMKKGVGAAQQARFVPVFHNEKEWKELAQFSAANDAYVVVVDRKGNVVWRTHGELDAGRLKELGELVRSLKARNEAAAAYIGL